MCEVHINLDHETKKINHFEKLEEKKKKKKKKENIKGRAKFEIKNQE